MSDQASLLDQVVNNKEYPIGVVSFLLVVKIGLIAVVGSAFFALNAGSLAIIAVLVAFIGALQFSNSIGGDAILRTPQSPFEESVAYWLPQVFFFLPGVILILQGIVSSFAPGQTFAFSFGASETYLSFIQQAEPWFVDVVNYDLATHVENWLIIPSGAVIYGFMREHTGLSKTLAIGLAATPMALIFSLLHGVSALAFALFAFGFMFLLIVGIGYEDSLPGTQIPLGLATLVASIGFHRGFNIGSFQELLNYYGTLWSLPGDFALLGQGIVVIDVIILGILFVGILLRMDTILEYLGDLF
jgi:hypothetical protein